MLSSIRFAICIIINNKNYFYFLGYGNPGGMDAGGTDFDPGE